MFNKVLKVLFPPQKKQTLQPAASSNNTQQTHSPQPTKAKKPSVIQMDIPLPPHDADFLNYLFGESELNTEIDPFSEYVAIQIENVLRSPRAMLHELPVMPGSVTTLINELKNDEFDVEKLIAVIEQEPSMAADVIKLANSARYRRSEKEVTDLKTAFMNMGAKGLIEGVIDAYIKNFVPKVSIYWRQFGEKIWQHSNRTASLAKEMIYEDLPGQDQSTAYFVGLICNLGKMVIFQIMIDAFRHVDPNIPPNSIVFKKLINNYAIRLTYTIARFWELPESILKAIAYQAVPSGHGSPLAIAVYEANYLSELHCLLECQSIDTDELEFRYKKSLTSLRARQHAEKMLTEIMV